MLLSRAEAADLLRWRDQFSNRLVTGHNGPMPTIGFLHTSPVHTPVFEALVAETEPAARSITRVDADLLQQARAVGPADAGVAAAIEAHLLRLRDQGAELVVCTCSTIGGVAEDIGGRTGVRVVRVDRPMAERAIAAAGRIVVLAALESTLAPTAELLTSVAAEQGAAIDVVVELVEGAWALFEAGDSGGYARTVADAITRVASRADVIVLAQASMAPAAELVDVDVEVLSSPRVAIESLLGA